MNILKCKQNHLKMFVFYILKICELLTITLTRHKRKNNYYYTIKISPDRIYTIHIFNAITRKIIITLGQLKTK